MSEYKDTTNAESIIYPIVRHFLQMGGTTLAGMGVLSNDEITIVIGALTSIFALSWGICKRKGVKICQY